jgi:hypothetical protein
MYFYNMKKNNVGRPPIKAENRKVVVKTTVEQRDQKKGKIAIDKLSKDRLAMIAYADGNATIIEKAKN